MSAQSLGQEGKAYRERDMDGYQGEDEDEGG